MARNFDGVAEGGDDINLGDIATAEALAADTWTMLAFFRAENWAADSRSIKSKADGWDTHDQYWLFVRPDNGRVRFATNDYAATIDTTAVVALDTWYLVAVTNDGLEQADSITVRLISMAGVVLDSVTGAHGGDNADLTAESRIGVGGSNNKDIMDGDIAYVSYFTTEFTQQEILEYLYQPARVAARKRANCEYFLPLNGSSPEVDWSGQLQDGVVTGTTVGDMPPVGPLFGTDLGWMGWVAPAGDIAQMATISWASIKAVATVAEASVKQMATINAN